MTTQHETQRETQDIRAAWRAEVARLCELATSATTAGADAISSTGVLAARREAVANTADALMLALLREHADAYTACELVAISRRAYGVFPR